ncbi:hypothetical protein J4443_04745 [Candidatus Woesearchaeota archaeon]|nr:hypothetical protein [Candidatus Woesearchaeota archaeon]
MAEDKYLEGLLKSVETNYNRERQVIRDLAKVIDEWNSGGVPLIFSRDRKVREFDPAHVKRIRIREGLTTTDLVRELNLPSKAIVTISKIEGGHLKLSEYVGGPVVSTYYAWLKGKGYNPFDL